MKKLVFSCSLFVFLFCFAIFISLNILVLVNKQQNELVLQVFNKIYSDEENDSNKFFSSTIEINKHNYVGTISIFYDNFELPIERECKNNIFSLQSACDCSSDKITILGTNLKNSFFNYKLYEIGNELELKNTFGIKNKYIIVDIIRSNYLNEVFDSNNDLIIIVKDYYALEYIGFICRKY